MQKTWLPKKLYASVNNILFLNKKQRFLLGFIEK